MTYINKLIVISLAITSSSISAFPAFTSSSSSYLKQLKKSSTSSTSSTLKMSYTLDPKETAAVFIEFQNEFTTEGGKLYDAVKPCLEKEGTLANGAKVLEAARANGLTVMHCPIAFEKGHNEISDVPYGILAGVKDGEAFLEGSWNAEICDSMKPKEGEMVVKGKTGLCGFKSTNLDFLLRQKGIKNVVMCGFLTNCCVESSMRTAYENGYKVYTVKDACAATSVEGHEATYEHNFGMFSIPTNTEEVVGAMKA